LFLYFSKSEVSDFSSLKGYVIFAYPEYLISNYADSIASYNNVPQNYNSLKHSSSYSSFEKFNNKYSESDNYLFKSGFFDFSLIYFLRPVLVTADKDPIRNFIAKLISEDTTYYGYRANIVVDTLTNAYEDLRTTRWQFALQIFSKEFNWKQKIFGGGFNFLNWYGYIFKKDKTQDDYPHNPFLHILLYSGIVGLFFYLWLLYKVFYYYKKYINEYYLFFVFSSLSPIHVPLYSLIFQSHVS